MGDRLQVAFVSRRFIPAFGGELHFSVGRTSPRARGARNDLMLAAMIVLWSCAPCCNRRRRLRMERPRAQHSRTSSRRLPLIPRRTGPNAGSLAPDGNAIGGRSYSSAPNWLSLSSQ